MIILLKKCVRRVKIILTSPGFVSFLLGFVIIPLFVPLTALFLFVIGSIAELLGMAGGSCYLGDNPPQITPGCIGDSILNTARNLLSLSSGAYFIMSVVITILIFVLLTRRRKQKISSA